MKKVFTAVLMLTLCFAAAGFGQAKKWQFLKVFPDTTRTFSTTGVHGLSVDPEGKVWIGGFGASDSVLSGGVQKTVVTVQVFKADGTPASFSPIKMVTIGATTDTLFSAKSIRGMRTGADGNVTFAHLDTYYKINYKTGAGIAKVKPSAASLTAPAFTSANEMFSAHVAGGNPIEIWDANFGPLGVAVASSVNFSRTLEVSKDGNDIYWCGYTGKPITKYHSDLGTLGPYAVVDSFAFGCFVESTSWNKKDGYLYASSGPIDTINYGVIPAPWKPETWYGFNVTTKKAMDSIVWNQSAYRYGYGKLGEPVVGVDLVPRPRAIDFSPTGDTAYIACYNYQKAPVQMFVRVNAASVEPVSNELPGNYTLSQNYPNPFNPSTEIVFALPKAGFTTVKVYDVVGKEVATLVNEELGVGTFKTTLDGSRLSSGTYIYSLTSGSTHISKKMMLVK